MVLRSLPPCPSVGSSGFGCKGSSGFKRLTRLRLGFRALEDAKTSTRFCKVWGLGFQRVLQLLGLY